MTEKNNLSRRRFLEATGAVASAAALTGYTGTKNEETDDSFEQQGGNQQGGNTLNLIEATMTTFDPVAATDTASGTVIQQIFDALMNYPNAEIEVEPLIATDYQTTNGFKTYRFDIKQGVTFHNGEPLTAQDFVYSFERLVASENSQRAYFALDSLNIKHKTDDQGNYVPESLGVRAVDDHTLEINLASPFHATLEMLAYTSFAAVQSGYVGDVPGIEGVVSQSEFSNNPVGSGPFKFERYQPNTEAVVTAYENYYGEGPQVDGIHWQIIEDDNAIYTYAMNRNAGIFNIPTPFYDPNKVNIKQTDALGRKVGTYGPLRNGETVNYLAVPTINAYYIGFNTNRVEQPARKAMAYVMNQQILVDQVFKGRGRPAYHFTPPRIYPGGDKAYTQHAQQNYPYGYNQTQIDQARQVMEDAGYGQNNRYSFTMTIYQSQSWQQIAQILRDQLASAHIDMQIEQAPFSTLIKRGLNGNLGAYSLGWVMDWPAPDNFLQLLNPPQTITSQPDAISYLNWQGTPAAQRARQAWQKIVNNAAPTDPAERARSEAYVTMEEANWEDVALLPVYHQTDERMNYNDVDVPKFGAAGTSRQMYNKTTIGGGNGTTGGGTTNGGNGN